MRQHMHQEIALPIERDRMNTVRDHVKAAKRRQEAHVEHPIGCVQHEDLNRRQIDRATLQVIDEPSRRGDDDIRAVG
jgi:hypothetical protein